MDNAKWRHNDVEILLAHIVDPKVKTTFSTSLAMFWAVLKNLERILDKNILKKETPRLSPRSFRCANAIGHSI